ncbi:hypothetical protein TeGR_g13263 [Tetraparma gracilis]|jgi:hypothetical protein|uniref:Uncharacterized protein n=1 Tax=Tetraparma gracilis TaxID=2962635 RepID=A0ABQ6MDG9_9STRA|nr:hypothetical protein TeGR_g13263 [Tetraparma gracilis]
MDKLLQSLGAHDCASRVLGKTVEIAPFERPAEILKWLKDFSQNFPKHVVENWIAVDDMPLESMHHKMGGHCVLTTISHGFLKHHIRISEDLITSRESPVSVAAFRA